MSLLTQEIVKHVFTKLGVANNDLHMAYQSIIDTSFILEEPFCLINDENEEINNSMWSCKIDIESKSFRLLLADCSSLGEEEYALIISLEGSPEYGIYFSITDPTACYIACLLNEFWTPANVYMQASFLAGMEQIKDLSLPWVRNEKTKDLYDKLVKFIGYHEEAL
jgi:hypothetical protein